MAGAQAVGGNMKKMRLTGDIISFGKCLFRAIDHWPRTRKHTEQIKKNMTFLAFGLEAFAPPFFFPPFFFAPFFGIYLDV